MSTSSGTLSTQRKIFFSYQGTPSIYSDIFFSSLLPLFVLPEKNWMGWSRGCDCANPWPCTSLCHKKANPLGIQKALTVPSDILRVPHSHSIFFKTLIQLWIELSHLSTIPSTQNWSNSLYPELSFPQLRWPKDQLGHPIFQTATSMAFLHWICFVSKAHLQNLFLQSDALLLTTIHLTHSKQSES